MSLLPLCPQDPKVTHKDVKEGSFKVVVDDLLLQVLLDTCLGLEEGDTNSSAGKTRSLGLPLTSRDGEEAGGGWNLEERLSVLSHCPRRSQKHQGSSARGLGPQH